MELYINTGKGGVGKTTTSTALALHLSQNSPTAIIDYDGGHSVIRTLYGEEEKSFLINTLEETEFPNLHLGIVEPIKTIPLSEWKKQGKTTEEYLHTFPKDLGYIPYHEMLLEFFGVMTDSATVSQFATLTQMYHKAQNLGIEKIVLDAEPTAGLVKLISSSKTIARSLTNLSGLGWAKKKAIASVWPDILKFLEGDYISNSEEYGNRMIETVETLLNAKYGIVTIPEASPISQMNDIKSMIEKWGCNIGAYFINNCRNEEGEEKQIKRVESIANGHPVLTINRIDSLAQGSQENRIETLLKLGKDIENIHLGFLDKTKNKHNTNRIIRINYTKEKTNQPPLNIKPDQAFNVMMMSGCDPITYQLILPPSFPIGINSNPTSSTTEYLRFLKGMG